MNEQKGMAIEKGARLEEAYTKYFSGQPAPSRVTTDRNGNFVMPSFYRPAKISYTSQVG